MNRKTRLNYLIIACFISISGIQLFAEYPTAESGAYLNNLGSLELQELKRAGLVFRYDEELKGPLYLPDSEFKSVVEDLHVKLAPEIMVEAFYFMDYPDSVSADKAEILNLISELTHKVSSISGVKYFSRTKQDYAVLFDTVYAVDNPSSGKRIADPVGGTMKTGSDSVYLFMDEHSMGPGFYRMDFLTSTDEMAVTLTNESSMKKVIKAVNPGDMKIFLQLIPCSDGILVYGYCGVVLQNDGFVNLLLDPYYSFYRRMTSMETWLYNSLHGTDMLPPLSEPMP
jgi:hypothetical protein